MRFRRTGVVLGALALALGLTAPASAAEQSYVPSPADFADCPAQPAGVTEWNCYVSIALEGGFTLGTKKNIRIILDKPLRVTAAEGKAADGSTVTAWGGITQPQNLKVVTVLPGTNVILSTLPEIEGRLVGVGLNRPDSIHEFKVKFQLWSPGGLLGQNCTIGTDAAPVVLKPQSTATLPWFFWLTPGIKIWANDDQYALPASTGCSTYPLLGHPDDLLGLPSASGVNSANFVWAVRQKKY
ncbi:hypothetical protein GCM10022221_19360 [Actinocorallia aurea]